MLEKNMLMPAPSRKKRIMVLLKIMYFFSGFTPLERKPRPVGGVKKIQRGPLEKIFLTGRGWGFPPKADPPLAEKPHPSFLTGFTLAMCLSISNSRTLNIDARRNVVGVMDLLERRENRFNKDSSGSPTGHPAG